MCSTCASEEVQEVHAAADLHVHPGHHSATCMVLSVQNMF